MKNVIDLTRRLGKSKEKAGAEPTTPTSRDPKAQVLDMTEKRAEIISQERRKVRRTILSEFIAAFALVPKKGLLKVRIFDISEDGLAFDTDMEAGHFLVGEEVAMRLYLNHETYFPFVIKIQNLRGMPDEAVFRHGVHFVKGTINDEALHHFVKFIETVSASLQTDHGDIQVSNLTR
ncbi:MAG: PilZ domain-containing protein [Bdellovibrionales bacterium]